MFEGKIFSIVWEDRRLPSGEVLVHETVDAPDVVRVYPVLGDRVLLIREYRAELDGHVVRTVSGRMAPTPQPISN